LLSPEGQDRYSPDQETEKSRIAVSPKLAFIEAGIQVSPVIMSCPSIPLPKSLCSTLFAAVYKRPSEGGLEGFLLFCLWLFGLESFSDLSFLGLWLDSFALGFLVWESFKKGKVWLKRG
jgi:hypothetical protein